MATIDAPTLATIVAALNLSGADAEIAQKFHAHLDANVDKFTNEELTVINSVLSGQSKEVEELRTRISAKL